MAPRSKRVGTALLLGVAYAAAMACAEELPPPTSASGGVGGSAGAGGAAAAGGGAGAAGCACAPDHATGSCSSGSCEIAACNPGYGDCDGLPQNGCEQSLKVAGNCGACKRSCLGAACTEGTCEAIVLVSGLTDPWAVLVDDDSVYFSDYTDGTIHKANKLDGSELTLLAGDPDTTWFMRLDAGYVYFTTRNGNTIERVATTGGPVELVASPGVKTSDLAIDGDHIYFTESEVQSGDGGPPGSVWRMTKTPGAPVGQWVSAQQAPYGITVDADWVYWGSANASGDGKVRKANKKNPSPGQEIALGQNIVRNLIADGGKVYWTTSDGRVIRYDPIDQVVVIAAHHPAEFCAVDEKYIYWAANDGAVGYVYRVEKDADPSQQPLSLPLALFAEAGAQPFGVAVDETAVYFTDDANGRVMKVAK